MTERIIKLDMKKPLDTARYERRRTDGVPNRRDRHIDDANDHHSRDYSSARKDRSAS